MWSISPIRITSCTPEETKVGCARGEKKVAGERSTRRDKTISVPVDFGLS